MASRVASSFTRNSLRSSARVNTFRAGRRGMSSGPSVAPKSDKPWAIGSLLVFGSAFLYLVSPSARTSEVWHKGTASTHKAHAHEEHHPTPEPAAAKVEMTDDEGTKADVTGSIAAAEAEDVPKAEPADISPPVAPAVEEEDKLEPAQEPADKEKKV